MVKNKKYSEGHKQSLGLTPLRETVVHIPTQEDYGELMGIYEMRTCSVNPKARRYQNRQGYTKAITKKENWTSANKLAKKSNTFNALFATLPENPDYQLNIFFECIKSVKLKGDFY